MDSEDQPFDMRKMKTKTWESAKIRTKTNGRWVYIYNPENNKLLNQAEPISFEKKYKPPNHTEEFYNHHRASTISRPSTSIRTRRFDNEEPFPRPPLLYSSYSGSRPLIAPVVYGQFVKTSPNKLRSAQTATVSKLFPEKTATPPKRLKRKAMSHSSMSPFLTKSENVEHNSVLFTNE